MIAYNLNPQHAPRKMTSVGDAVSQLPAFSELYRGLYDFVEDGGLDKFGIDANDLARWRTNFRDGVINIGGKPSEIDFFRLMMGGTPKETEATDLYIEYNSALDFNIYAENDATGTTGSVTNAYFGSTVNGTYAGPYAVFDIAVDTYADNGTLSNINVGDQIYNYNDSKSFQVIKKDVTTDFAHHIYVAPMDPNYVIQIYAKQPMMPLHVQMTSGYSDVTTSPPHSEWETVGYIKRIQPFSLRTGWELPRDLLMAYKDVMQFPVIFDTLTGAEMDSWDFKTTSAARLRMIASENMLFWSGEPLENTSLTTANYTDKYNGFEGFVTTMFYGGGNIDEYDNGYGWDMDIDGQRIMLETDAVKKTTEYLLLDSKRFQQNLERRSQDMFKNNSGACTFDTFERMGDDSADIKRLGVKSYTWGTDTFHLREVSAWSDTRYVGNGYFPNMAVLLSGNGLTDSRGNDVAPVEYWIPKGQRLSGQWEETWVDEMLQSNHAAKFSGTITHTIMMSVNAVENMWAIMPKFLNA